MKLPFNVERGAARGNLRVHIGLQTPLSQHPEESPIFLLQINPMNLGTSPNLHRTDSEVATDIRRQRDQQGNHA
jgi:hypothetical protein